MSWKSPGDPVTDYVIYYQSKGGPVISDRVSGGETETHSLDGLQRGVTYYISIVALSPHLPSLLVGPTTVVGISFSYLSFHLQAYLQATLSLDPLLVVETSPQSLTTSPNNQFSINCTARAEIDGQSIPLDIEWIRIVIFPPSGPSELMSTLYTTTGSPERGYQSVLTTSENDRVNTIIYHCIARAQNYSSTFNDTTMIIIKVIPGMFIFSGA